MHLATEAVTGSTVSDAWLRTVLSVTDASDKRCHHAVTRIVQPDAHVPAIRAAADWLSGRLGYPSIDTVANTIFPEELAATCTDHEELTDRYRRIYELIRGLDKANRRGTYFGRDGWPGGISPPGSHRSRREPRGSPGSCHPGHQTRGTEGAHFQCANMRGYRAVMPRQHSSAFFLARSRLYFLRIQRTR